MRKRYFMGCVVTGISICVILVVNLLIFPTILANSLEEGEVKQIKDENPVGNQEEAPLTEEEVSWAWEKKSEYNKYKDVSETGEDLGNAISQEQAVHIAFEVFKQMEDVNMDEIEYYNVKSIGGVAPSNPSQWLITVNIHWPPTNYNVEGEDSMEGEEPIEDEEPLEMGEEIPMAMVDGRSGPVLPTSGIIRGNGPGTVEHRTVIINAITGEWDVFFETEEEGIWYPINNLE